MNRFASYATLESAHDLTFLADTPYVYHCHHFNLFHDQTVDDVLGEEEGFALRVRKARDAFFPLLRDLYAATRAETRVERVECAQDLLASMGQGRLAIEIGEADVRATATHLHYGTAWRAKYAEQVRRLDPVDAVSAGLLAACAELLRGEGPFMAREEQCVAMRASHCELSATPNDKVARGTPVNRAETLRWFRTEGATGLDEEEIGTIARGLQGFMRGVTGDDRGLVHAFNVFVTQHLPAYYCDTSYSAIRRMEALSPASVSSCEDLFREAGHVCVFNTFGNILMSPEWEGMVGPLRGDPTEIVRGCTAIARGLGFGRWVVREHVPQKRLVLAASSNYEAASWLSQYGPSDRSRSYFMQGAAMGFMVLSSRVPWIERPALNQRFYDNLFSSGTLGFKVETPRCLTMGQPETEIVVSAT